MNRVATLHTRRRSLRPAQRRGVGITVVTALIALVFFFPVLIAVLNSFKDQGRNHCLGPHAASDADP